MFKPSLYSERFQDKDKLYYKSQIAMENQDILSVSCVDQYIETNILNSSVSFQQKEFLNFFKKHDKIGLTKKNCFTSKKYTQMQQTLKVEV